jgi:hypothetical protein
VSSSDWILGKESEEQVLNPWLASEPDPEVRRRVLEWLAELVRDPVFRGTEEEPGIWHERVPGTRVGVTWVRDDDNKRVMLAVIGNED